MNRTYYPWRECYISMPTESLNRVPIQGHHFIRTVMDEDPMLCYRVVFHQYATLAEITALKLQGK